MCASALFWLLRLQSAKEQLEQLAEFLHLLWPERLFEQRSVAARQFRIELAKQLNTFGAQSNQHTAPVVAGRDSLDQSSGLEPVEYPGDSALGDQGPLRYFGATKARVLRSGERDEYVQLREGQIVSQMRTLRVIGEKKTGPDQCPYGVDEGLVIALGNLGYERRLFRQARWFRRHGYLLSDNHAINNLPLN